MELRIVVADDNQAVLKELTSLLQPEFVVVAMAENGKAAVDLIRQNRPDVAVVDFAMPVLNGIQVAREISTMPSPPAIVICSSSTDPDIIEAAREAGAMGYVFKISMARDLVKAVRSVARGETFISAYGPSPSNEPTGSRFYVFDG